MTKLTISDAAEKLGVSKEAIHNRIRRGSLESVVENGVKFVLIGKDKDLKSQPLRAARKTASHSDERYYKFLEEQNAKLQQKVETLQGETRMLRDQKEQMLIEERKKIEQIYKEKDEQLKNIINAISSKFILNAPEEPLEAEIEHVQIQKEDTTEEKRLVPLGKYLKSKNFSKKKRAKIKDEFKARAQEDPRVIEIDKKYYIDLQKYDYSDFSI